MHTPFLASLGLGADLYEDGYRDITNIDTSALVIRQMNELFHDLEDLECKPDIWWDRLRDVFPCNPWVTLV